MKRNCSQCAFAEPWKDIPVDMLEKAPNLSVKGITQVGKCGNKLLSENFRKLDLYRGAEKPDAIYIGDTRAQILFPDCRGFVKINEGDKIFLDNSHRPG